MMNSSFLSSAADGLSAAVVGEIGNHSHYSNNRNTFQGEQGLFSYILPSFHPYLTKTMTHILPACPHTLWQRYTEGGDGLRRFLLLTAMLLLCAALLPRASGAASDAYIIHVDVETKRLTLWQGDALIRTYTVATGTWDTPTPLGVFRITHRFSGQMGGFGTCFLGLNVPWGNYGIHGTNKPESIGYNASHGCIRMHVKDAEELYALVPNGTQVVIECGAYGELGGTLRTLRNGDRSSMVRAVQRKLRALGFYHGWPDGVFGPGTQTAVDAARKAYGLSPNGLVDWSLYQKLGLTLFE